MFDNFKFKTIKLDTYKAVIKDYNEMPKLFYTYDLIKRVRELTNKQTYDGTILRVLRGYRQRKQIDYIVIDLQQSQYKKK